MKSGKVVAINISQQKGVPKTSVSSGHLLVNFGLENDAHGGDWHRQVSLLASESFDKVRQKVLDAGLPPLEWGRFAENITTSNIELHTLSIGTQMTIGEALLEVTQIGKTCHQGCAIFHQVGECVMPREGIFAKVLRNGVVQPGDTIHIL